MHAGAHEQDLHGSSGHQTHGPDGSDEEGTCDCAGSCTISSSAPMDRHAGEVTELLGFDSIDLLPAAREPHARLRSWLFPLPNAPPCI